MPNTTHDEPVIVAAHLPPNARDDAPFIRAYLEQIAAENGLVLAGVPRVERMEPARIEVNGVEVYPFGEGPGYRAECEAKPKPAEKPAELPTFVPHERTVEAIARRIAAKSTSVAWDDMAAVVRNVWMRHALDLVNAAAPFLVADATRHVANHHLHYGLGSGFELQLAQDVAKAAADDAESQQRP